MDNLLISYMKGNSRDEKDRGLSFCVNISPEHLNVIPDEDLVVHDELVILQHTVEAADNHHSSSSPSSSSS